MNTWRAIPITGAKLEMARQDEESKSRCSIGIVTCEVCPHVFRYHALSHPILVRETAREVAR